ncbi:hypothetical protein [Streptomyces sp. NPDC004728]|uniref:hypothetical protein n=1 Tax=Streptomyces sp. NPDC004728 TaxID=3154289 RepID=UPI0033A7AFB8
MPSGRRARYTVRRRSSGFQTGTLDAGQVAELERLGTVWSEQDAAWTDGAAKGYATVHGRFLLPTTAVQEGHPLGV